MKAHTYLPERSPVILSAAKDQAARQPPRVFLAEG